MWCASYITKLHKASCTWGSCSKCFDEQWLGSEIIALICNFSSTPEGCLIYFPLSFLLLTMLSLPSFHPFSLDFFMLHFFSCPCLENFHERAGEKSLLVKCLLANHEYSSSGPPHPHEKLDVVVHACNPSFVEAEIEWPRGLPATQPSLIDKPQVPVSYPTLQNKQNNQGMASEESCLRRWAHPRLTSGFTKKCAYTYHSSHTGTEKEKFQCDQVNETKARDGGLLRMSQNKQMEEPGKHPLDCEPSGKEIRCGPLDSQLSRRGLSGRRMVLLGLT